MAPVLRVLACAVSCLALLPAQALAGAHHSIVNGRATPPRPWLGLLLSGVGPDYTALRYCGAVAIRPNVAITAASCILDEVPVKAHFSGRAAAVFGQENPWQTIVDTTASGNTVVQAIIPKQFRELSDHTLFDDVAVLRLKDRVSRRLGLLPARSARSARAGTSATVFGWGPASGIGTDTPSSLQRADLRLLSPASCTASWPLFESAAMICGKSSTQIPCLGDGGGPLIVVGPGGSPTVAGVLSFADMQCRAGVPALFTSLVHEPLASFVAFTAARLQKAADAGTPPPAATRQRRP